MYMYTYTYICLKMHENIKINIHEEMLRENGTYINNGSSFLLKKLDGGGFGERVQIRPDQNIGRTA